MQKSWKMHGVLAALCRESASDIPIGSSLVVCWSNLFIPCHKQSFHCDRGWSTFLSDVTNRASYFPQNMPSSSFARFYLTWGSYHINVLFCLLWICAWCNDHFWFFFVWKFFWFIVLKYLYDYHWKVLMFRKYLYYAICGNIIIIEKCWCFREYFCELQYVGM